MGLTHLNKITGELSPAALAQLADVQDSIRHAANAISEFPELARLHSELWDMANDIAVELDRTQGGAAE